MFIVYAQIITKITTMKEKQVLFTTLMTRHGGKLLKKVKFVSDGHEYEFPRVDVAVYPADMKDALQMLVDSPIFEVFGFEREISQEEIDEIKSQLISDSYPRSRIVRLESV